MIQTIETLSLPAVGYKLTEGKVYEHFAQKAVQSQYDRLPMRYFQVDVNEDKIEEIYTHALTQNLTAHLHQWDETLECKVLSVDVIDGKWCPTRYSFNCEDYALIREKLHDKTDWDSLIVDAIADFEEMLKEQDPTELHILCDERWLQLYDKTDAFDEFYWDCFEKMDASQWRNYRHNHEPYLDPKERVHPTIDFLCWCIDTQDYDNFYAKINNNNATVQIAAQTLPQKGMEKNQQTAGQTAQVSTTNEFAQYFADALAIDEVKSSKQEWSGTMGGTLTLHCPDINTTFTYDSTILGSGKRKGKMCAHRNQWTMEDGVKLSWSSPKKAGIAFKAMKDGNSALVLECMTSTCRDKFTKGTASKAEPQKVEEPKAETPKFRGSYYKTPHSNILYCFDCEKPTDTQIRALSIGSDLEVMNDKIVELARVKAIIAAHHMEAIEPEEKYWAKLRELGMEIKEGEFEEPKAEPQKVEKPTPEEPEPEPVKEEPKAEEPKVEEPKTVEKPKPQAKADKKVVEIKHPQFEKVLNILKCGEAAYLYGPAGTGKNHMCKQLAEALGLDFEYIGCITQEFKLLGYEDANGVYHPTPFYHAFTEGKLFFIDELDGSIEDAAIIINAALANGYCNFPGIGNVNAHPNFRCVAAGNTLGKGADDEYTGRHQLDAATLDRFTPIPINYDRNVELSIAKGNTELVDFIEDCRQAVKECNIQHVISYRATTRLTKFIECFDKKEAIKLAVFGSIESDDLRVISRNCKADRNLFTKELKRLANVM